MGDSIPFRSLGYSSLEQLIRTVPDLKITSIGNELYIDVKPDEKTMHITKLVRGQKSSKKKVVKYVTIIMYFYYEILLYILVL